MRSLIVAFLFSVSAWCADVTGNWTISINNGATANPIELVLKQDGTKLTGSYKAAGGEVPLKGSVKGNAIEFVVTLAKRKVEYRGAVTDTGMSGVYEIPGADQGRWHAQKKN